MRPRGEDNTADTTDMFLGMCMANIYGQEAIDKYGDGSEGSEVLSYVYDYMETDENRFYIRCWGLQWEQ